MVYSVYYDKLKAFLLFASLVFDPKIDRTKTTILAKFQVNDAKLKMKIFNVIFLCKCFPFSKIKKNDVDRDDYILPLAFVVVSTKSTNNFSDNDDVHGITK